MGLNQLKVSAQLILGVVTMMMFIVITGVISHMDANKIYQQTEELYKHPLMIRSALENLKLEISEMRLANRDLLLSDSRAEQENAIMRMEKAEAEATNLFNVLKNNILESRSDIDSAFTYFTNWKVSRKNNTSLALDGRTAEAKKNIKAQGASSTERVKMLFFLNKVDNAADKKAMALLARSNEIRLNLNRNLTVLVVFFIIISLFIAFFLLANVRLPIKELQEVTTRFKEGDLNARSSLKIENEFGILAASFNSLVEKIQNEVELSKKIDDITGAMLAIDNSHKFFRELLPVLAKHTNSQTASVYLLTEDKRHFEHYESVGLGEDVEKQEFSAYGLDGEFGTVLTSHKIEYVKDIPHDTRYVFKTVSGTIIPREIITIPIVAGNEVVAIISIASIRKYSEQTIQLVEKMFDILTARVEGILAYRKMRKFAKQLKTQNSELEYHKQELEQKSLQLIGQNHELEVQKNQLHEVSRHKTIFLSNMSHELRTPLNSIITLSGVLSRRLASQIPEDEYSYLEVIERNGKNLLLLINNILDISRIESGREKIEITRFDPEELVGEIISMIKPQASQKNVRLEHQPGKRESFSLESDRDKCYHILQNLIANAVKFTEKGEVKVVVEKYSNTVRFIISDTGIGISADHIPHIFDEFRQADCSTSRRFGGTGLGLAIANKYATLLGGRITVDSIIDKGSVFVVTLPDSDTINHENEAATIHKTLQDMKTNRQPASP
ncbi:MAG TPA: ATP-binding protein, partial [Paludibacter sp.]|nr:ATP-binding protein [Paludibacter sp.]